MSKQILDLLPESCQLNCNVVCIPICYRCKLFHGSLCASSSKNTVSDTQESTETQVTYYY